MALARHARLLERKLQYSKDAALDMESHWLRSRNLRAKATLKMNMERDLRGTVAPTGWLSARTARAVETYLMLSIL